MAPKNLKKMKWNRSNVNNFFFFRVFTFWLEFKRLAAVSVNHFTKKVCRHFRWAISKVRQFKCVSHIFEIRSPKENKNANFFNGETETGRRFTFLAIVFFQRLLLSFFLSSFNTHTQAEKKKGLAYKRDNIHRIRSFTLHNNKHVEQ